MPYGHSLALIILSITSLVLTAGESGVDTKRPQNDELKAKAEIYVNNLRDSILTEKYTKKRSAAFSDAYYGSPLEYSPEQEAVSGKLFKEPAAGSIGLILLERSFDKDSVRIFPHLSRVAVYKSLIKKRLHPYANNFLNSILKQAEGAADEFKADMSYGVYSAVESLTQYYDKEVISPQTVTDLTVRIKALRKEYKDDLAVSFLNMTISRLENFMVDIPGRTESNRTLSDY